MREPPLRLVGVPQTLLPQAVVVVAVAGVVVVVVAVAAVDVVAAVGVALAWYLTA